VRRGRAGRPLRHGARICTGSCADSVTHRVGAATPPGLQKAYWKEHSTEATLETMLLDTKARELDEKERPEIMGASSQNEGGAE